MAEEQTGKSESARTEIDLRRAINAVSDVIQNRPRPLREFDQIYMKAGDMVLQAEFVARWANGRKLAFIGDGDAIGICAAYFQHCGITDYGPSQVTIFDFDERIVGAVTRFADSYKVPALSGIRYNCLDAFPSCGDYEYFYTNPPWGASNNGESVNVFVQRGMEAVGYDGEGTVVIADDRELDWTKQVLARVQTFASGNGFFVSRMIPRLHQYHLDDAPDLQSCNLLFASLPGNHPPGPSEAINDKERLENFYGKSRAPRVQYIRERKRLEYGRANEDEYELQPLEPR